jgi:serine-type D-Ala-D-Ala carboxypeptidase (penicillin-binding protein 5/6)
VTFAPKSGIALGAGIVAAALAGGHAHGQKVMAPPEVTAKSVYVLNADTGQTLYRKGDGKTVRLHSITKLITAHVLMQRMGGGLSETVTIGPAHLTTGSSAGLRKGDVWTLENLLYGMLLVSGNDAALAIADYTGRAMLAEEGKKGDPRKRFVREMTQSAVALGAARAKFADPHGLSPANTGTAQDVAGIGSAVFRDERLRPFWRCAQRVVEIGGLEARTVTLNSTVEMLGEERILGAKTGSHLSKNIYNLVAGWRAPNGQTIVAVVLGSADHPARYRDMRAILAALPHDFPELSAPTGGAWASGPCPEAPPPPLPVRP